jgi:hypothetical protein
LQPGQLVLFLSFYLARELTLVEEYRIEFEAEEHPE